MLRSRRVALIYAVQNFAQLDDIYGRARHPTIVTNANGCATRFCNAELSRLNALAQGAFHLAGSDAWDSGALTQLRG
jgi:TraM recognition site of TraD and TraG